MSQEFIYEEMKLSLEWNKGCRPMKCTPESKVPLSIREQMPAIRKELMLRTCSQGSGGI